MPGAVRGTAVPVGMIEPSDPVCGSEQREQRLLLLLDGPGRLSAPSRMRTSARGA